MRKIRHVLGISGGKDSAALAIYLKNTYPALEIEYYFADTGKELDETYEFISNLEVYLGQNVIRLRAVKESPIDPFEHFLARYGGYLPSKQARWCTRHLKLEPFEAFVSNDPVVSYVAIRGDEDREGYVSHKPNIQTIYPFRKNIWSEDVITKVLSNAHLAQLVEAYDQLANGKKRNMMLEVAKCPVSFEFAQDQKLRALLDLNVPLFNQVVFEFLKTTQYPLGTVPSFPLLENQDVLGREDVFRLLADSGVGKPKYYTELPLVVNGQQGTYCRSRSGCFFCFFQQKIEWVWLYEQHPALFEKAKEYEKDGYAWNEGERLEDLVKPERMNRIKEEYLTKTTKACSLKKSNKLLDILLDDTEFEGCVACFV